MNDSAILARSVTWRSSKQSYLTAVLLADRNLVDDCLRAYAYFRWADDRIDLDTSSDNDRLRFLERQTKLVESCYRNQRPADITTEEEMLAELIAHDRGNTDGLQSFIRNFLWVLEFDALRRGRPVRAQDLDAYSAHLAKAVMDGFQYFIGNSHPYPKSPDRTLAVLGAHVTHMLRDMREDLASGYVNLPAEHFPSAGLDPDDLDGEFFRAWVRGEVVRARRLLRDGRRYIDSLDVLRCKLAGIWYCARFERVLDLIERDGYRLRTDYPERKNLATWMHIAGLSLPVTVKHCLQQIRKSTSRILARSEQTPEAS
ncbi:MAG: squalene/phytoene synthase family protein [Anaerolineales bacterium]